MRRGWLGPGRMRQQREFRQHERAPPRDLEAAARARRSSSPGRASRPRPGSVKIGSAAFPESVAARRHLRRRDGGQGRQGHQDSSTSASAASTSPRSRTARSTPCRSTPARSCPTSTPTATAKTPDDVYAALQTAAAAKASRCCSSRRPRTATRSPSPRRRRDKYHLTSIADLKSVASKLTLGAPAQFRTRADGVPGAEERLRRDVRDGSPRSRPAARSPSTALKNGSIDAADIFSTDPAIAKNGFVSLRIPRACSRRRTSCRCSRQKMLTQPMIDACNAVSAKLDTATLAELVAEASERERPGHGRPRAGWRAPGSAEDARSPDRGRFTTARAVNRPRLAP